MPEPPSTSRLFDKVISQSAPVVLTFPTKDEAYEKYEPVAERAGCARGADAAAQVACLRKTKANKQQTAADESWDHTKKTAFAGPLGADERIRTADPFITSLEEG